MTRDSFAEMIAHSLSTQHEALTTAFHTPGRIPSFVLDDLLEPSLTAAIHAAFPPMSSMRLRKTLREFKYTEAQMDRLASILEEVTFAFQDPRVVERVAAITNMPALLPDPHLYAGGISLMTRGNFLNPHLDNSHDKDCQRYRALNLLFYVTPDWNDDDGGHLELWDHGPKGAPRTIHSRFNRLVVMATNRSSWHSVSPVTSDRARCCVSNYFFSPIPPAEQHYYHVTSFRGRPEQPARDLLLQADNALRGGIRKVFKQGGGVLDTDHVYRPVDARDADERQ